MVETRDFILGGKEYKLKCSILTTESFERLTGKKFGSVISRYQKMSKVLTEKSEEEANEYLVENIFDIEMDALQLTYCMVLEAKKDGHNKDFNMSMEEFINDVGVLGTDELKGVLAAAAALFPRKLQK